VLVLKNQCNILNYMSKNNIKFSFLSIIIMFSLVLGVIAYAEEKVEINKPERERIGETIKEIKGELKNNIREFRGESEAKKEGVLKEFEYQKELAKKEIEAKREEIKTKMEGLVGGVKAAREEYKKEIEIKKEEVKVKIAEMKTSFKESLLKVKDENKKISAEKIVNTIQSLNTKLTTQLFDKINQIENVLISIESRISKAETNGIDTSSIKTEIDSAKASIVKARESVSLQSQKVYSTTITSEAKLKTEIKALRDTFKNDMKTTSDIVRASHVSVKTVSTTLAKINGIDDENKVTPATETATVTN
jgi:hypothetical protein